MSRGALKELIAVSVSKFARMTQNVPHSEKKEIVNVLTHRANVLGDI